MPIHYYRGWYSPELVEANPEVVFVFGDNTKRRGMGGQAIIRGWPNAYGVATKRVGDMAGSSFFEEGNEDDLKAVQADLAGLRKLLEQGRKVLIPVSNQANAVSLGLERAQLPIRAPSLYRLIVDAISEWHNEFGGWDGELSDG